MTTTPTILLVGGPRNGTKRPFRGGSAIEFPERAGLMSIGGAYYRTHRYEIRRGRVAKYAGVSPWGWVSWR